MKTFGEQLTTWMNANHMNLTQLSKKSQIVYQRLKMLQDNQVKPSRGEIENLCKAFRETPDIFLMGCDVTYEQEQKGIIPDHIKEAMENEKKLKDAEYIITKIVNTYASYTKTLKFYYTKKVMEYAVALAKKNGNDTGVSGATYYDMDNTTYNRYCNGKMTVSLGFLTTFYRKSAASGEDVEKLHETILNKVIPNYNIYQLYLASEYKMKSDFFKMINFICNNQLDDSTVGHWLSMNHGISERTLTILCPCIGVDMELFTTEIMDEDNVKEIVSRLKERYEQFKAETVSEEQKAEAVVEEVPKTQKTETHIKPENTEGAEDAYFVRLKKIWRYLTEEHKAEIYALCDKYFFEDWG